MMLTHLDPRTVLLRSIGGLALVLVAGGLAMSALEDLTLRQGLWMVFNVISTVGFGTGPISSGGQLLATFVLVAAAVCYFWIAVEVVEVAMDRFQHRALVNEALRPLARRRTSRLYQDN